MFPYTGDLHGAILRTELQRQVSVHKLRAEVASGLLIPYGRNVLVDHARAAEFQTRAAAAILHSGPRAVLTSHSAARLYGCTAADVAPIHVLMPYDQHLRSRSDLMVHNGRFTAADIAEVQGIRVLRLASSLAALACRARPRAALACLDQALAMVPMDQRPTMRGLIADQVVDRPDPRGRIQATQLLELATGLPESPAESWLLLILVEGGIPMPSLQYSVCELSGRERYRLDFAWPELKVAVEYDGYEAHEGRAELDKARDEDLRRRGWLVVRADAADLKVPDRLLFAVRTAFTRRRTAA
jgi:hypothetical protein